MILFVPRERVSKQLSVFVRRMLSGDDSAIVDSSNCLDAIYAVKYEFCSVNAALRDEARAFLQAPRHALHDRPSSF